MLVALGSFIPFRGDRTTRAEDGGNGVRPGRGLLEFPRGSGTGLLIVLMLMECSSCISYILVEVWEKNKSDMKCDLVSATEEERRRKFELSTSNGSTPFHMGIDAGEQSS